MRFMELTAENGDPVLVNVANCDFKPAKVRPSLALDGIDGDLPPISGTAVRSRADAKAEPIHVLQTYDQIKASLQDSTLSLHDSQIIGKRVQQAMAEDGQAMAHDTRATLGAHLRSGARGPFMTPN